MTVSVTSASVARAVMPTDVPTETFSATVFAAASVSVMAETANSFISFISMENGSVTVLPLPSTPVMKISCDVKLSKSRLAVPETISSLPTILKLLFVRGVPF